MMNSVFLPQGSEFQINTQTASSQQSAAIAVENDGDFVVAWESNAQDGDGYGIYAQHYNRFGTAIGGEFRVNTFTNGDQRTPAIATDSSGNFVVVWSSSSQDGSGEGIYAQRYNSLGIAQGSEFRVNTYTTSNQGSPAIALSPAG
ncbi:MAG: flagellar hook associated protein, partial [Oscillatoriales cyanobacterium SM2_1_8]|nr:flagellar hook associated protein [Oscillatoriales cyanobacterium SM2_1_8]